MPQSKRTSMQEGSPPEIPSEASAEASSCQPQQTPSLPGGRVRYERSAHQSAKHYTDECPKILGGHYWPTDFSVGTSSSTSKRRATQALDSLAHLNDDDDKNDGNQPFVSPRPARSSSLSPERKPTSMELDESPLKMKATSLKKEAANDDEHSKNNSNYRSSSYLDHKHGLSTLERIHTLESWERSSSKRKRTVTHQRRSLPTRKNANSIAAASLPARDDDDDEEISSPKEDLPRKRTKTTNDTKEGVSNISAECNSASAKREEEQQSPPSVASNPNQEEKLPAKRGELPCSSNTVKPDSIEHALKTERHCKIIRAEGDICEKEDKQTETNKSQSASTDSNQTAERPRQESKRLHPDNYDNCTSNSIADNAAENNHKYDFGTLNTNTNEKEKPDKSASGVRGNEEENKTGTKEANSSSTETEIITNASDKDTVETGAAPCEPQNDAAKAEDDETMDENINDVEEGDDSASVQEAYSQVENFMFRDGDESQVCRLTFLILKQFMPYIVQERYGGNAVGKRVMACKHCWRFRSLSSPENGLKSFHHFLPHFLDKCHALPAHVKNELKSEGKGSDGPGKKTLVKNIFDRLEDIDEELVLKVQLHFSQKADAAAPQRAKKAGQSGKAAVPKRAKKAIQSDGAKLEKIFLRQQIDPSPDMYREETAFLFHDAPFPGDGIDCEEAVEDALPLPPPLPFPTAEDFPLGSSIKWTLHPTERVLLADFSGIRRGCIPEKDFSFFTKMMERDDLTLISEGLYTPNDAKMWKMQNITEGLGGVFHHKFRRYKYDGEEYVEQPGMLKMKVDDFFRYIKERQNAIEKRHANIEPNVETEFKAQAKDGSEVKIDPKVDVLYMLDFDVPKYWPALDTNLHSTDFKLPGILPGGELCSLFHVPFSARNFMGPNLYICPSGGYTHFHQDGFGCVDSGHLCLSGYNEVIMLRRLPTRHKRLVNEDLRKILKNSSNTYDSVHVFPHSDGEKPSWPTKNVIRTWEDRNYCPSVFILRPGQHVHINKGRMHAFRKLGTEKLQPWDCHFEARNALIAEVGMIGQAPLAVSIAWDWQFRGVTSEGIHRETTSMLESQYLLREGLMSLATSRAALFAMARNVCVEEGEGETLIRVDRNHFDIADRSIAKGIAPAVKYVIRQELEIYREIEKIATKSRLPALNVCKIIEETDQEPDPETSQIDPFANDYVCHGCGAELENVYLHCFGCERISGKDYNLCGKCYLGGQAKNHHLFVAKAEVERNSSINHIGKRQGATCYSCLQGMPKNCWECKKCFECACICHTSFTLQTRFFTKETLESMLTKFESLEHVCEPQELTEARLDVARDRIGDGIVAKTRVLKKLLGDAFIAGPKAATPPNGEEKPNLSDKTLLKDKERCPPSDTQGSIEAEKTCEDTSMEHGPEAKQSLIVEDNEQCPSLDTEGSIESEMNCEDQSEEHVSDAKKPSMEEAEHGISSKSEEIIDVEMNREDQSVEHGCDAKTTSLTTEGIIDVEMKREDQLEKHACDVKNTSFDTEGSIGSEAKCDDQSGERGCDLINTPSNTEGSIDTEMKRENQCEERGCDAKKSPERPPTAEAGSETKLDHDAAERRMSDPVSKENRVDTHLNGSNQPVDMETSVDLPAFKEESQSGFDCSSEVKAVQGTNGLGVALPSACDDHSQSSYSVLARDSV